MQTISLDNFELHNNTSPGHFMTRQPIQGLEIPLLRTSSFARSGQDGEIVASQFFGERRILLTGFTINTTTSADYLTQRKAFLAACIPLKDSSGFLLSRTLKFTEDDGTQYRISVQVMKATMPKDNLLNANWTLDLLATDNTVNSETLTNDTITQYIGGGFILPVILPITALPGSGSVVVSTNNGSANSYPTITLSGPLTNPIVTNQTTGMFMQLTATIAAGETYVIDTINRTIIQGGVTNRLYTKTTSSTFWYLQPGNNTLALTTSVSGENGHAVVSHRDAWIGL